MSVLETLLEAFLIILTLASPYLLYLAIRRRFRSFLDRRQADPNERPVPLARDYIPRSYEHLFGFFKSIGIFVLAVFLFAVVASTFKSVGILAALGVVVFVALSFFAPPLPEDLDLTGYRLLDWIITLPFRALWGGSQALFDFIQRGYYAYGSAKFQREQLPEVNPRATPPTPQESAEAVRMLRVAKAQVDEASKLIEHYSEGNDVSTFAALDLANVTLVKARNLDPTATLLDEQHHSWTVDTIAGYAFATEALQHSRHANADYYRHGDVTAYKQKLITNTRLKHFEKAFACIRKAYRYEPQSNYKLIEANLYWQVNKNPEARAIVDELLKDDPDNVGLLTFRERL